MSFNSWLQNLKSTGGLASGRRLLSQPRRHKPATNYRLTLECLEDRLVPSTFTVLNTNDSGAGSFRDAITQVNADPQPGTDTINFAIGSGAQTITPLSAWPTMSHPVVIDGTSQPGFAGTPLIDLWGERISGNGLTISANNCVIKDLVINQFAYGIDIVGNGNLLQGNYIGTDATGTVSMGNGNGAFPNVEIDGTSNTVGGTTPGARNLISGNLNGDGVRLKGPGNLVEGNYIGTDVTGTKALGNEIGVRIVAPSNILGGTTPGAGNLISGNYGGGGVWLQANSNVVQGNYIGTDATGTQVLHNSGGLLLAGSSNVIGGITPGARNLLAQGIVGRGTGNVVQGNYIGTDVTGRIAFGGGAGFLPSWLLVNTFGGATPAAGNLIDTESVIVNGYGVTLPIAPVLTSAVSVNGTITISGTLNRGLNSTYTLNFFSDAAGTAYLGSSSVTTDATGEATFTVTFAGALSPGQVITATSVDASYNTSMLSAGLGTVLEVTGFPATTTAGAAGAFTVTVQNLDGSTATSYAGTIHFSSSDPKAVLPADYTFTAADQGIHTFSAILKTAGNNSLIATDTLTGSIAGTQAGIVVKPAAASQIVISSPSSVTHGVAFSLTLTLEDAYGNVVTGYVGTLHFTSSDSTATLSANYTFTAADAGQHTFTNKTILRKKGTQTITITDTLKSGLTVSVSISVA